MITTRTLGQRLCRNLTVPDLARVPAAEIGRLQDAINDGLMEYFNGLHDDRKTSQPAPAATLRAAVTVNIQILDGANGFEYLAGPSSFPIGGYGNEEALIGHSVVIDGDGKVNRLMRSGELMYPYFGAGGDVTATFYGDCAPFSQDDMKVVKEPRFRGETGSQSTGLVQMDDIRKQQWQEYPLIDVPETGCPRYWWIEPHLAAERTATPTWMIRVWPLPVARGLLLYSTQFYPSALTFDDMLIARELPVPDRELGMLVDLISDRLLKSPIWNPDVDKKIAREDAEKARKSLAATQHPLHSSGNRCGTAEGF